MQTDYTNMTTEDLQSLRMQTEYDISKYRTFQLARKTQLNSAYGAIG